MRRRRNGTSSPLRRVIVTQKCSRWPCSIFGPRRARDLSEAARLLEFAAKLGHAACAYDLGLLYTGPQFTEDFKRAGLSRCAQAAEVGNSEAEAQSRSRQYKEAAASQKTSTKARCSWDSRPLVAAISTPWSSSLSRNSTGTVTPRLEAMAAQLFLSSSAPRQPDCTKSPCTDPHGRSRACPRTQQKPSNGTGLRRPAARATRDLDVFAGKQKPEVREAATRVQRNPRPPHLPALDACHHRQMTAPCNIPLGSMS